MAFWCVFLMKVLMWVLGTFRLVNCSVEFLCMAPLTPTVMVMRGLVFQPLFRSVVISGSYLACLWVQDCLGNL